MSGYSLPRPIAEDNDTSSFDSGEPSLDEYLRKRVASPPPPRCLALHRHLPRQPGRRLLCPGPDSVQHPGLTGKARRNMPDPVPVILLSGWRWTASSKASDWARTCCATPSCSSNRYPSKEPTDARPSVGTVASPVTARWMVALTKDPVADVSVAGCRTVAVPVE